MENPENPNTTQILEMADDRIATAFDRTIILADESEWTGTLGLDSDRQSLWIWLYEDYSISDVFSAFSNPDKTSTIRMIIRTTLNHDVITEEYEGYTQFADLKFREGVISIRLSRG